MSSISAVATSSLAHQAHQAQQAQQAQQAKAAQTDSDGDHDNDAPNPRPRKRRNPASSTSWRKAYLPYHHQHGLRRHAPRTGRLALKALVQRAEARCAFVA